MLNYDQLWKAFIRPPRSYYSSTDLGPKVNHIGKYKVYRRDFELENQKREILRCTLFEPELIAQGTSDVNYQEQFPCVVYCHCNSGSRFEGMNYLETILSRGIGLCCFDFSGSGLSDGQYVTLGYNECSDLKFIIDYLRNTGKISYIGLLGRSMGAVTTLLYAPKDPNIVCLVADSPFSSLTKLAQEIANEYAAVVPNFLIDGVLKLVKSSVMKQAGFSIDDINPMNCVQITRVPGIFITSKQDTFVRAHHTEALYHSYAGSRELLYVKGGHNSERPKNIKDHIGDFFKLQFQEKQLRQKDSKLLSSIFQTQQQLFNSPQISNTNAINPNTNTTPTVPTQILSNPSSPLIPKNTNNNNINSNINGTPLITQKTTVYGGYSNYENNVEKSPITDQRPLGNANNQTTNTPNNNNNNNIDKPIQQSPSTQPTTNTTSGQKFLSVKNFLKSSENFSYENRDVTNVNQNQYQIIPTFAPKIENQIEISKDNGQNLNVSSSSSSNSISNIGAYSNQQIGAKQQENSFSSSTVDSDTRRKVDFPSTEDYYYQIPNETTDFRRRLQSEGSIHIEPKRFRQISDQEINQSPQNYHRKDSYYQEETIIPYERPVVINKTYEQKASPMVNNAFHRSPVSKYYYEEITPAYYPQENNYQSPRVNYYKKEYENENSPYSPQTNHYNQRTSYGGAYLAEVPEISDFSENKNQYLKSSTSKNSTSSSATNQTQSPILRARESLQPIINPLRFSTYVNKMPVNELPSSVSQRLTTSSNFKYQDHEKYGYRYN